jgi:hypothetical protein
MCHAGHITISTPHSAEALLRLVASCSRSIWSVSDTDRQCNPRLLGDGFVPVTVTLAVAVEQKLQTD